LATDQSITAEKDTEFETVIGLEVHAQLLTNSKAFAPVSNLFGSAPNTNITPLCIGHPGTLPVLNENLVRYAIRIGLATNCRIAPKSIFARKNYFYPDMPKGYQISQYETPICHDGYVDISPDDGTGKRIRIKRIHMEEDAGKSIHDQDPVNTLVDLNRAGTPLVEIVTEPDISSPAEAYAYLTIIRQLVQYLGICDGNMEEGSLRCDANVSIRPGGQKELGTRTELKNLNSFRNVERAITYEVERQKHILRNGGRIEQQTLLWDPNRMETRQMRSKEEAHDYRYFPEPDLPPVFVTPEFIEEVRRELPELPGSRRKRFVDDLKLPPKDASIITDNRETADYFEAVVQETGKEHARAISNLLLTEVMRVLNEKGIDIRDFGIEPGRLAGLLTLRSGDKISSSAMQTIFNAMTESPKQAVDIATEMNLLQVSDSGFLEPLVEEVIASNPEEVARFREGKEGLIGFFVGQVMKGSKGKANPQMVKDLLLAKLKGG
jgi:aspartyl-tRNA(Asn)/glutamyl-tRNA(Gln) amidotransferase subunit B